LSPSYPQASSARGCGGCGAPVGAPSGAGAALALVAALALRRRPAIVLFKKGPFEPLRGLDLGVDLDDLEAEEPPWQVTIINDEFTPMEYVVALLRSVFGLGLWRAIKITYAAHTRGAARVCEVPRSEAKALVRRALDRARADGQERLRFRSGPVDS
jgi:ATP-dependent Clp protease adaptor protein ClpS